MKRSQLALAIAGLLASSSSFAVIDGTTATDPTPVYFVKGLPASQSSLVVIPEAYTTSITDGSATTLPANVTNGTALMAVKFKAGFGIPKGTTQFIRLDLVGGAKFSQNLTCFATGTGFALDCNTREGGAGKPYATFTLGSSNVAVTPSDEVTFYFKTVDASNGVIKAPSTDTNLQLTYTLHNSNASADDGPDGSGLLGSSKRTIPYVSFRSPVTAYFAGYNGATTIPPNSLSSNSPNLAATSDLVADVAVDFKQFLIGSNTPTTKLGSLRLEIVGDTSSSTYTNLADGSTTNFIATPIKSDGANLFSTGTTIELSGDFSFLQDTLNGEPKGSFDSAGSLVSLANAGSCGSPLATQGTKTVNGSKIIFDLGTAAGGVAGQNVDVCVTANSASPIPAVPAIGITFNPKGVNDIKLDAVSQPNFARIVLNGSILDTPYFSNNAKYINRIILTNTSSKDLDYKILDVVTDAVDANGVAVPAPIPLITGGKIPANANLFLKVESLLPPTAAARVAIRFSITGSNKAVQGVAQTVKKVNVINGGAGDLQTVPLVRQCGGAGCK